MQDKLIKEKALYEAANRYLIDEMAVFKDDSGRAIDIPDSYLEQDGNIDEDGKKTPKVKLKKGFEKDLHKSARDQARENLPEDIKEEFEEEIKPELETYAISLVPEFIVESDDYFKPPKFMVRDLEKVVYKRLRDIILDKYGRTKSGLDRFSAMRLPYEVWVYTSKGPFGKKSIFFEMLDKAANEYIVNKRSKKSGKSAKFENSQFVLDTDSDLLFE